MVNVRNDLPNEARCRICGKVIRGTSRQIEDLALGTLGHHREG